MMNYINKVAVLLLALILIQSSLSACSAETDSDHSVLDTDKSTEMDTISADPLPSDLSFEGNSIDFLSRGISWYDQEILADESSAEVVDVAVYKRQLATEERLNVVLTETRTGTDDWHGPLGTLEPIILAGDDIYEVAASSMRGIMKATVMEGYFHKISNLPYIDLTKSYWSQSFAEASSIGNTQYAVTGSLSLTLHKMVWLTYFNSTLVDQYIDDDLYQIVRDGKWTLDKLQAYTQDVYVDTNGDGVRDAEDTYGLVMTLQNTPDAFYSSCDIKLAAKDKDDIPYLDVNLEKTVSVVEKLNALMWESNGAMGFNLSDAYPESASSYVYANQFTNGTAMFFMARALVAEDAPYREMEDSYGLLPYPKYDEAQKTYKSYAHDPFTVFVIPGTSGSADCTAAVLEYMAYESEKNVIPAYYDVALSTKYIHDLASREMLDIAFDDITMNPAQIYLNVIGELPSKILTFQIWKNTDTVSSEYEANIDAAKNNLNAFIDQIYS